MPVSVTLKRMLRFTALNTRNTGLGRIIGKMFTIFSKNPIAALLLAFIFSVAIAGQSVGSLPYKSQEVDKDGVPVLVKHLPDWEKIRDRVSFARSVAELHSALGDRAILDQIDFSAGTEAVTAPYDAGKLLIVEYSSPQASIEADTKFVGELGNELGTVYRRIGNYNTFVFDSTDPQAANALLDQVKYEKSVQWLGKNPFAISAERAFVLTTSDIFLSTVLVIVMGIGFSIFAGLITGYVFYMVREHRRANMPTFSDAGGMTRLNLDGFTPDIIPERLLKD